MTSQSKIRLALEVREANDRAAEAQRQVVALLRWASQVREEHPDIEFPPLPDQYSEGAWRAAL